MVSRVLMYEQSQGDIKFLSQYADCERAAIIGCKPTDIVVTMGASSTMTFTYGDEITNRSVKLSDLARGGMKTDSNKLQRRIDTQLNAHNKTKAIMYQSGSNRTC